MSILEILTYPDQRLKEVAHRVEAFDDSVKKLIADMLETLRQEEKNVGLAANQVGVLKRVIVINAPKSREDFDDRVEMALVNPEILFSEGSCVGEEGCLSFPGITTDVKRASHVIVRALDGEGKPVEIDAEGFLAIVFQHEIDHLDGKLIIDRVSRIKRDILKRRYKKIKQEMEEEAVL
jgi:peptide deformylase